MSSPLYSIVVPARNEAANLPQTVTAIHEAFARAGIPFEIVVVNDHSTDHTSAVLEQLKVTRMPLRECRNPLRAGFGNAVRYGISQAQGGVVAIMMADGSDAPADAVVFYRKIAIEGYDCCFGTRWSQGGRVEGYPRHKLVLNRLVNWMISLLFGIGYNDTSNAFKAYRSEVLDACQPLLSHHFNLTVEIPLKAIIRGYRFAVVPNSWRNRRHGTSHLKIKEMGSRYAFIILYCLLEKWLARGDYHRRSRVPEGA